jgi:4-hydroxybenzoate polyprenyltransferase
MILTCYIRLLRPHQWIKNLMIFFPPFLGGTLLLPGIPYEGVVPFLSFCLVSSANYVLNDLRDRVSDSHHPVKKHRPLASGRISTQAALALLVALLFCSSVLASTVSVPFALILLGYLVIAVGYSFWFKHVPVADLFCISAGFLLRLQAGGVVFGIIISEWLYLSVFLLSVFLSTGKRLAEKAVLGCEGGNHRKALRRYPPGFLEGTMYMTGSCVLVTYAMYVVSRGSLVYTVPLCCFGLLRYMFRIKSGQSGDPTESLIRDPLLFVVGFLWTVMVGWGIYGH